MRPWSPPGRRTSTASGQVVAALLSQGLAAGKIKGCKAGPVAFLSYLIAHESYHRAEIGLSLTAAGRPLPEAVAYAMWDMWSK